MPRPVYLSYHYAADADRARQVRERARLRAPEAHEDPDAKALRLGPRQLEALVDEEIARRSCLIVLIGRQTRGRRWVNYEIFRAWNARKGVLGIRVHQLADQSGLTPAPGPNPFDEFHLADGRRRLSSVVPVFDTPFVCPKSALAHICGNLDDWIDEAIRVRRDYQG